MQPLYNVTSNIATSSKIAKTAGDTEMSKTYRIKSQFSDKLEKMRIDMIVETRVGMSETDVLHASLWKYLDKMTAKDVLKYKEWLEEQEEK